MALEKNIEQLTRSTTPSNDDLIYVAQGGLDRAMRRGDFLSGVGGGGTGEVTIADVTGLQGALDAKAPTTHTHGQADITGLTTTLAGKAPLEHSHTTDEVTGLDTALAGKSDTGHTHTAATTTTDGFMSAADKTKLDGLVQGGDGGPVAIADVTGLQTELDSKSDVGHAHAIADVTSLQAALDGKAATVHSHNITDIPGLETELDSKSDTGHIHAVADVTGLQGALDGKAATSHTHTIANVTGLQAALDAKSATGHTHAIADVSGLQGALDGKSATGHTHANATTTDAGFMSPADKTKLDGITGGGTFATETQAREGTDTTTYMNPLRTHQAVDEYVSSREVSGTDTQVLGFDASGNAIAVNNMRSMMVAVVGEEQALAIGDGKRTFRQAIALNLRELEVFTPTSGSTATTVDVVVNGTSILSAPISIAGGSSVATLISFASASIPKGATVRIDIDAAGTGAKGLWVNFSGIAV